MTELLTYVIIFGAIAYFSFFKLYPFVKKMLHIFGVYPPKVFVKKESNLSDEQYKKISLGAIYSEQQGAYINTLKTGLGRLQIIKNLSEWWDIHNQMDAAKKLDYLRDKGFRHYLSAVLAAYQTPDRAQDALSVFNDPEDLEKASSQLENLMETEEQLKEKGVITSVEDIKRLGVAGWDCGRLVFLTRLCFDAGYINQTEAWQYIDSAYGLAKQSFSGWSDYAKSYVTGRAMWGGASSGNEGIADIADYLLELPNSPWKQMALR